MVSIRELREMRRAAEDFGWPGRRQNAPNAKTGTFTGYWKSGRTSWKGSFVAGNPEGIWSYTSRYGKSTEKHAYCNL